MKKDVLTYIKDNFIKDAKIVVEDDNLLLTADVTDTVTISNNITFRILTNVPDIEKATRIIFTHSDKWNLYLKFPTHTLDITDTVQVLGTHHRPLNNINISLNGSPIKSHRIVNSSTQFKIQFKNHNFVNSIFYLKYEI